MDNKKNQQGFTLIELLIVMSIASVIFGAIFTTQAGLITDTNKDATVKEVVEALRLAQTRAITRFNDDTWGVYFDEDAGGNDDKFVVFKGANYAARTAGHDIITNLSDDISLSNISFTGGGDDVIFAEITGKTATDGSLRVNDNRGNYTTISINTQGVVDLN